jgi:predicted nucleic acid-binding protein
LSLVVDSSVIVAALVDAGPDGAWAEKIVENEPLHAPELVCVEVTNILRRLERARLVTTPEATAAYHDLTQLRFELYAFGPFSDRIWELRHAVTSYDGWYVALAEALELPLATLDKRLARAKGPNCTVLVPDRRGF